MPLKLKGKHTPLPWRVATTRSVVGPSGEHVTFTPHHAASRTLVATAEANADLIVTAVNAHADLIAAMERVLALSLSDEPIGVRMDLIEGVARNALRKVAI